MTANLERFKQDLSKLISLGDVMRLDLNARNLSDSGKLSKEHQETAKKLKGSFEGNYQRWYSEGLAVLRQLMPDRLPEFRQLYEADGKRKKIDNLTYCIQDWINGVRSGENYLREKHFNDLSIVSMRFNTQIEILKSVQARFESSLFDVAQLVRADLFDSELDSARELAKNGFLRG